jgi:hypothetical protein
MILHASIENRVTHSDHQPAQQARILNHANLRSLSGHSMHHCVDSLQMRFAQGCHAANFDFQNAQPRFILVSILLGDIRQNRKALLVDQQM